MNALLACLWIFGDPTTMTTDPATGALNFASFFLLAHLGLSILQAGFQGISGNIVIPMTADCADYETYRSGKYVPGLMGPLFSFVDKIVSSFAPMIAGLVFAEDGRDPGQGCCHQGCFRQLIYTLSADPSPPFS